MALTYHEPQFQRGDDVTFSINMSGKGEEPVHLRGTVEVVDTFGAGMVTDECCYDVSVKGLGWFKHLRESMLKPAMGE